MHFFQDGWPQNALQLASVLLSASKSVSGSALGRGLATPGQFVDQVSLCNSTDSRVFGIKCPKNYFKIVPDVIVCYYKCRVCFRHVAYDRTNQDLIIIFSVMHLRVFFLGLWTSCNSKSPFK